MLKKLSYIFALSSRDYDFYLSLQSFKISVANAQQLFMANKEYWNWDAADENK